ncbi:MULTISPECIES: thioredoxin fold domain-containing protein [Enterobacteriaceae]|uniref:thioredoxin fold domain-containing protein n=1 Tax=Enterobacteriaceae TaxID=543 RepID=UPI0006982455|nr:thioredoxin fold domain-containing protein [Klebsiella aerogenes]
MSKFTEAMKIMFAKKNVVIGNTSFEQKGDDLLYICDGANRWCIDPAGLGVIYLMEKIGKNSINEFMKSELMICFLDNTSNYICLSDSYDLNEKKLRYLLELKRSGCKKGLASKIGLSALLTITNSILVLLTAMMLFNTATGSEGHKRIDDTVIPNHTVASELTGGVPSTQNQISSSKVNLSPEQQLLARNEQLTQPNPELAALLQKGVNAGDYSFTLGGPVKQTDKGTLYVFSDPLCPRCQDLEPLLEKLSADYRIQVFPVSVIGNSATIEASSRLVKSVLCEAPEARSAAWLKIMRDPNATTADCEAGPIALKNNIDTFHAYNFIGTPALVRADGASFDLTKRKSAESVTHWLDEAAK